MKLASCLSTGDWNFLGPQYGTRIMSPNWRLGFCGSAKWNLLHVSQFCGSAVWNLLHVSQQSTGILWVRSMELASCLSTVDWNFVGPQVGTRIMSPNWQLGFCGSAKWNLLHVSQFCGSAVWNLLHVSQESTGILWVRSVELGSCLPTGDWDFVGPLNGTCFMSLNFVGPQYGISFMSLKSRLEFCGSAVWTSDHVSQLATGILWVRKMELASCLSTVDWNFMGPQYGTWIMSPNWRLEFYDSPPPQSHWRNIPQWTRYSSLSWLHDHTQAHHIR